MDFWRRQNWNIAGRAGTWFLIAAVLVGIGMVAWGIRGLNYGIDFTGGAIYKLKCERPLATGPGQVAPVLAEIRGILAGLQIARTQVQMSGGDLIYIRTGTVTQEATRGEEQKILQALEQKLGSQAGVITPSGIDLVGPVVGKQLRNSALLAIILGNLGILIYLTVRYEFRFAVAGIIALLHDVLFMVGVMALFRVELNSEFVAAILTVVGYSINDSVVIYDRIRENRRLHRGADLEATVNASLLQTMNRSINTVLTVLFTLLAIFFFGGATIRPFALAMLAGMATGMYSSIFIASPLVVAWDKWSRRRRAEQVGRRRAALAVAGSATPVAGGTEVAEEIEGRPAPAVSAEQAMRRAQNAAQEDKRAERRERREKKGAGKGKRRH